MTILLVSLLHLDKSIDTFIQNYGSLTYLILFLIIFFETGLVVTPFLPGDSLLFAAAAFAAKGSLNIFILMFVLTIAAFAGDSVNYFIGKKLGLRLTRSRFVKAKHIHSTEKFYEKHGGKAIVLARFVPIIRTFAPFIAGISKMNYSKFLTYNIAGSFIWIFSILTIGYSFGNIPLVKNHFSLVSGAIVLLSFIPTLIAYVVEKQKKNKNQTM